MAYDFQVTVDATDPHTLADWWAETLDWQVEPSDEDFIRDMVRKGFATDEETTTHKGVLVWKAGAAIMHPDRLPRGKPRRVLFQWVPEAKTVKDRIHLDVWVGADQREAVHEKLLARGATFLHRAQQGPFEWITMADPEGNEFCLS